MKFEKELVEGSFILLLSFGIYNVFNFLFQASMARLLSLSEFGTLSVLFNIIYVFGGFSESVQITITKFSANEKDDGKIKNILKRALKKSFFISFLVFFIFCLAAFFISSLTKINYFLVSFTGMMIFLMLLTPINRGVLQGKKNFKALGVNMISESVSKFVLAGAFVILGWGVFGAILGTFIGGAFAFCLTFVSLKKYLKSKENAGETKDIYKYSKSSLFVIMSILIFYSFDVILVKIIFPPEIAGSYAIASLMAKAIFFGTIPISKAMFPISADTKTGNIKSKSVLLNALGIILLLSFAALAIFYFYPGFVIKIFSGKEILGAEGILFYLGIGTTILSLSNLFILYKLSLGEFKNYLAFFFLIIIIILAFTIFSLSRSLDLEGFSRAFIFACLAFLFASVFFIRKG